MGREALEFNFQEIEFFQQPGDGDKIAQVMKHRVDQRRLFSIKLPFGSNSALLTVYGLFRLIIQ